MLHDINSIEDVIAFAKVVAREVKDGNPFTLEASQLAQLDKCFEVCAKLNKNLIYLLIVMLEEARDHSIVIKETYSIHVSKSNQ